MLEAFGPPRHRSPLIGVTGPDRHGAVAWYFTLFAVWRAGGRARRITPSKPRVLSQLDGLIMGGGADVDPRLYGEEPASLSHVWEHMKRVRRGTMERWWRLAFLPLIYALRILLSRKQHEDSTDNLRDDLEFGLLELALQEQLPIMGICRGAQLLNVQRGGTLHQHLVDFYADRPQIHSVFPEKRIRLVPGSKLAEILGTTQCRVNGLHSQAVDQPGRGLTIVAREENQVVQGIEDGSMPFVLGVQWHPEYMQQVPRQQRLFAALVQAAREHARISYEEEAR